MRFAKLDNMVRGWMVGKFTPNLYEKDYEIGFKYYKLGDYEKAHKHELSEEVTVILFGEVEMNGDRYKEGDVVVQERGEYTDFRCVSERAITAIYRPDGSFPSDKYFKED